MVDMTIEELGYRGSAATQFLIRFLAWMESQKKAASSERGPRLGAGLVLILSMMSLTLVLSFVQQRMLV